MAVRARDYGSIGEELTGLQRGPERLDRLGDQRIRETNGHQHPPPAWTFTRRSRGPPHPGRAQRADRRCASPSGAASRRPARYSSTSHRRHSGPSRSRQCCDHRENPSPAHRDRSPNRSYGTAGDPSSLNFVLERPRCWVCRWGFLGGTPTCDQGPVKTRRCGRSTWRAARNYLRFDRSSLLVSRR